MRLQTSKLTTLSLALGTLFSSMAIAQDIRLEERTTQKVPTGTSAQADSDATFMTSDFMGLIVKDKADQNLGEVKDLVINAQGEVLYLAVLPERAREEDGLVFLPFAALNLDGHKDHKITYVTTVITRDRFVEAPVFTRQRFYASGGPAPVFAQVNRFFGVRGPRVGFGFNDRGRRGDRDGFRGDRDGRDRDQRDGDRDRDGRDRDGRNRDGKAIDSDSPADRNSKEGETPRRMRKDQDSKPEKNGEALPKRDTDVKKPKTESGSVEGGAKAKVEVETPRKGNSPKVEAPKVRAPKAETPKAEAPSVEQPSSPAPEAKPEE